jgi:hypothetical protein
LRALRANKSATSTRLAKRAPAMGELTPQAPNAVRVEVNAFGNFEEYDDAGNLVFARLAGVELPAEFRH